MKHFLFRLSYDGSRFFGYQKQLNQRTVQAVLLDALRRLFGEVTQMAGCSRTDSGVHALDFCVSFSVETEMSCDTVQRAINALLPADIAVFSVTETEESFHARYSVVRKEYIYKIYQSPVRSPFLNGYALHYTRSLDLERMNRAAAQFCGTHDFTSFMASGSKITDPVRTVYDARIAKEGDMTVFTVSADGFLYNMVRIMVGTLLEVSEGKIDCDAIGDIIGAKDRIRAGRTAPACGLYLNRVFYRE